MKLSAALVVTFLLASCVASLEAKSYGVVNPAVKKRILTRINRFRRSYGAPNLIWSTGLARSAQAWTNKCIFSHDLAGLQRLGYGENLSLIGGPWEAAIELWLNEAGTYKYGYNVNGGWQAQAGHFTQVVWKDTVSIGCAQSACIPKLGNNLWSCRFHPPGNYLGAFQANVFEKGSKVRGRG